MRFIHTADIHLDSPLAGLAERAGERASDLVGATRRAFAGLIEFAINQNVDFVLIAGDLYDGNWRDFTTGLVFVDAMAQLRRADIRAAIVMGNHDAENVMTRRLKLPENVHVFRSDRAETIVWEDIGVAVHGRSYPRSDLSDDIAAHYPEPRAGLFNIGLLHTAADGRPPHAPYAPCSVAELAVKGYDYWALGHVHKAERLSESPWIVFPGNLQGRHANETGPKGCVLVTVENQRVVAADQVSMDVVRWAHVQVELGGVPSLDLAWQRVGDCLGAAAAEAEGRTLAVRLSLVGETPVHRAIAGDHERTTAECAGLVLQAGGDIWLERVLIETRELAGAPIVPTDAVGELLRTIQVVRADPAERETIRSIISESLGRIPQVIKVEVGLDVLDDEVLDRIVRDVEATLLTRILGADGGD